MLTLLQIPEPLAGQLWQHRYTGRAHGAHRHAELEFNLVTRGTCTYLIGDRKYVLRRNCLAWLFPSQDHVILDESPDREMWVGVFKERTLRQVCATQRSAPLLATDPPHHFVRQIGHSAADELHRTCSYISAQAETPDLYNAGLGFLAMAAWQAYCEAPLGAPGDDIHPAVEKAIRLIRDEIEAQNMDQLARQCGMSASRLSFLFKEQTGMTLVAFRNRQRIDRFKVLYRAGRGVSLMQAALDAGFGSYPQFHRIFKELVGCSPAQYRKTTA